MCWRTRGNRKQKKVKLFNIVYGVYNILELIDSYSGKNESKYIIYQIGADGCKRTTPIL